MQPRAIGARENQPIFTATPYSPVDHHDAAHSTGSLPPTVLVEEALRVLQEKCRKTLRSLQAARRETAAKLEK